VSQARLTLESYRFYRSASRPRASLHFGADTLFLTEASRKRRAALHVVAGASDLARFDRGGIDVLESSLAQFAEVLRRENHTLKRTLTDPRLFSGIGNAYSDEILHRARLSPLQLSGVSDRGTAPRRPRVVAAAQERLAPESRRVGRAFRSQAKAWLS
jgi:formamidopyrimidine-DNA glycosylase